MCVFLSSHFSEFHASFAFHMRRRWTVRETAGLRIASFDSWPRTPISCNQDVTSASRCSLGLTAAMAAPDGAIQHHCARKTSAQAGAGCGRTSVPLQHERVASFFFSFGCDPPALLLLVQQEAVLKSLMCHGIFAAVEEKETSKQEKRQIKPLEMSVGFIPLHHAVKKRRFRQNRPV